MYGAGDCAVAANQIKDRETVFVTNDRLTIDQAGANRKLADCRGDKGKAVREVVSVAGDEPHARTIPPRQNAEAVMFDFVNPIRTRRRCLGGRW